MVIKFPNYKTNRLTIILISSKSEINSMSGYRNINLTNIQYRNLNKMNLDQFILFIMRD
jgi:hypothetical protein